MTIPYTTGTVSVTAGSPVVTGLGTAWLTGGIVGGVFGADRSDGNPIPILSVDSDTQITLAKPWRGATAAAQPYWIIRDTAYLRQLTDNAQKLATYIARLDNATLAAIAALAGSMAADKVPYATGAGTMDWTALTALGRSIIGATAGGTIYGALGEIPEAELPSRLRGVGAGPADLNTITDTGFYLGGTTALNTPTAGGRFFVVHQRYLSTIMLQTAIQWSNTTRVYQRIYNSTAWSPWVVVGAPILGTVAQTAGVPTGAIIERGSNANGEYVRFADGTQICVSPVINVDINLANGTVFSTAGIISPPYPAAFAATPHPFGGIHSTVNAWTNTRCLSTTWGASAWAGASRTGDSMKLGAIGRWF
jgi:hypothetical protein|nr:pyocin knob domain-containing protein [Neorhizobium tomejilense]